MVKDEWVFAFLYFSSILMLMVWIVTKIIVIVITKYVNCNYDITDNGDCRRDNEVSDERSNDDNQSKI